MEQQIKLLAGYYLVQQKILNSGTDRIQDRYGAARTACSLQPHDRIFLGIHLIPFDNINRRRTGDG